MINFNDWPRRNNLMSLTPVEVAIYNAVQEIEKLGADVRLTDALVHLQDAANLVADYVESKLETKYEYEYLFRSDENEICPIYGWFPIAADRIKHPEKIQEYIDKGILRRKN